MVRTRSNVFTLQVHFDMINAKLEEAQIDSQILNLKKWMECDENYSR
jgi:hypothetical protein